MLAEPKNNESWALTLNMRFAVWLLQKVLRLVHPEPFVGVRVWGDQIEVVKWRTPQMLSCRLVFSL